MLVEMLNDVLCVAPDAADESRGQAELEQHTDEI